MHLFTHSKESNNRPFQGLRGGVHGKRTCLPMQETWVWSLGQEDPLEKEMATHSSILTWRIPWTEEPGGLPTGSERVRHDWSDLAAAAAATFQAPLPMEFPRQEYWSGLPFPSPGDLPDPGIKPTSPALAGKFFTTEPPGQGSTD